MAKKLTSLLMALAVSGSIIPSNVMAEGTLSLKDFNATKTAIMLNFTSTDDAAAAYALQSDQDTSNDIKITKRDSSGNVSQLASSDFTQILTTDMQGTNAEGTAVATAAANTLILKPTAGIDTNAIYRVEAGGASTGWFKVTEFFADDFNATEHINDANTPYTAGEGFYKSTNWDVSAGADKTGDSWSNQNGIINDKLQLFNGNNGAYVNATGLPTDKRVMDYTVEAELTVPTNTSGGQYSNPLAGLSVRSGETGTGGADKAKNGYAIAVCAGGTEIQLTSGYSSGYTVISKVAVEKQSTKTLNVRLSAIGSNIQGYVDDKKLFDAVDSANQSKTGSVGFFGMAANKSAVYSGLDNVSVTKITKLGEFDADSSITLKGFNATKSVITVDFDGVIGEIKSDNLADKIIITKKVPNSTTEETVTDFTANVSAVKKGTDASENEVVTSQANTIIIKPTAGISTDALYRVQVEGIEDIAMSAFGGADTGWFKVTEFFADDFETGITSSNKTTVTPAAPYSWSGDTLGSGYLQSAKWTATHRENFTTIGDGNSTISNYNKFMLRNNGQNVYLNQKGLPLAERVSDYTIEAELGLPKSMNKSVRMDIRNSEASASNGYGIVFSEGNYTNKTANVTLLGNTISTYKLNDNVINVRMSAIGSDIACYIDNDKIFETTDTTITRAGGIGVSGGSTYNVSPHITLDNVSLTKVERATIPETASILSYNADTEAVYLELGELGMSGNDITDFSGVTLKDNLGADVLKDISVTDGRIVIEPKEDLNCNEKYTVSVKDLHTTYGTAITDYTKDFQVVKVWEETFDNAASVTQEDSGDGWTTTWRTGNNAETSKAAFSWDEAGRLKIDNSRGESGLDRITANTDYYAANPNYTTKFDLYAYDDASLNKELQFYTNKAHAKAYNETGMNFKFFQGKLEILKYTGNSPTTIRTNTEITADVNWNTTGSTYTIKDMKQNGTGRVTINGKEQAVYDYSAYELTGGTFGLRVGSGATIGIDNILITYAADWVTGEGAAKDKMAVTDAKTVKSEDGNDVTATVSVQCNEDIGNYTVIAAAYNNGKLLGVISADVANYSLGVAKETVLELKGVQGVTDTKIFVWDSLGGMKPLVQPKN